jgi:hypothetical protein
MLVKVTSVKACPAAAGVPRLRSGDPGVPGVHPACSGRRLHLEHIRPVLGIRENASRRSVTATTDMNLPLTARSACRPAARPRRRAVVAAMAVAPRPEGASMVPPATGNASQNVRSGTAQIAAQSHSNGRHNGGSRASRNSKVTTQRNEGAGLTVLHGLGAGRRPQRPPAVDGSGLPSSICPAGSDRLLKTP